MKLSGFDLLPTPTLGKTLPRGNSAPAAELFTTFTLNKGIKP